MSSDIIYNKQFIKVSEDRFVPMILSGSSNCTEFVNGRERRERSWNTYKYMLRGGCVGTLAEMLETAHEINNGNKDRENYNENQFGWFEALNIKGTKTTFNNFINLFKSGCKNAKTIEELRELHINTVVEASHIPYNSTIERKCLPARTTEELLKSIDELKDFYKGTNIVVTVRFSNSADSVSRSIKNIYGVDAIAKRNKRYENKQVLNNAKETYQIQLPNGGYLIKLTSHGYKWIGYGSYQCKRFLTEKAANAYLKKNEHRNFLKTCKAVKVER